MKNKILIPKSSRTPMQRATIYMSLFDVTYGEDLDKPFNKVYEILLADATAPRYICSAQKTVETYSIGAHVTLDPSRKNKRISEKLYDKIDDLRQMYTSYEYNYFEWYAILPKGSFQRVAKFTYFHTGRLHLHKFYEKKCEELREIADNISYFVDEFCDQQQINNRRFEKSIITQAHV